MPRVGAYEASYVCLCQIKVHVFVEQMLVVNSKCAE